MTKFNQNLFAMLLFALSMVGNSTAGQDKSFSIKPYIIPGVIAMGAAGYVGWRYMSFARSKKPRASDRTSSITTSTSIDRSAITDDYSAKLVPNIPFVRTLPPSKKPHCSLITDGMGKSGDVISGSEPDIKNAWQHSYSKQLEEMGKDIRLWMDQEKLIGDLIAEDIKELRGIRFPSPLEKEALKLAENYEECLRHYKNKVEQFLTGEGDNHIGLDLYLIREDLKKLRYRLWRKFGDTPFKRSADLISRQDKLTRDLEWRQLNVALDISQSFRPKHKTLHAGQFERDSVMPFQLATSINPEDMVPIVMIHTLDINVISEFEGIEVMGQMMNGREGVKSRVIMAPFWSLSHAFQSCLWQHKESGPALEFIFRHEMAHLNKLHAMQRKSGILTRHDEELEADADAMNASKLMKVGGMTYFASALMYSLLRTLYDSLVKAKIYQEETIMLGLRKNVLPVLFVQEAAETPISSHPSLCTRFLKCAQGMSKQECSAAIDLSKSLVEKTNDVFMNRMRLQYPKICALALDYTSEMLKMECDKMWIG